MEETSGASKVPPLSPVSSEYLATGEGCFEVDWTKAANSNSSFLKTTSAVEDQVKATLSQFFIAAIQCLIIVFTLIGNGLVVAAVASFHRLRSVTNYFVVSLAVADLAVAVFVMPYSVLRDLWAKWVFGWVLCYFWISFDVMCCTASILHLCVIAVDRYLAINEPLSYATHLSTRHPEFIIAAIWMCSAAISFGPIFMGWFADGPVTDCGLHVNKVYAVISSATSFYLPLVVMVVVYVKIFCIARRQAKEIVKLEKSVDRDGVRNHDNNRSHAHARRYGRDLKAIKTLGTLMGLFCVSWLPFFIVYVARPFCHPTTCFISFCLDRTITWLGYCNSFFNPCVYGLLNKDFRFAYKRLLLCQQRALHLGRQHFPPDGVVNRKRIICNSDVGDCGSAREHFIRANEYELK